MSERLHTTEECAAMKKKKTSLHLPYQWLILTGGPYSPTPQRFIVRHTRAQFLHPPSAVSVYTRLCLSDLKVNTFYSLELIPEYLIKQFSPHCKINFDQSHLMFEQKHSSEV